MSEYCLVVKWTYEYDKEGTWFDTDCGEERYPLIEGATYPLPHFRKKGLEIRELRKNEDSVTAELFVDHRTITLCGVGNPITAHASDSYSVCGDSVHQSLCLHMTIQNNEQSDRN